MLLIKLFRIGPVTGPRSAVLDLGLRPRSNTANLGLFRDWTRTEIFINYLSKVHIDPYHPLAPQAYHRNS